MISTKGRYALRAMIDLAEHARDGEYVPLMEVAERQQISEKYLESIVSSLSKAGLVKGVRGKGGGYRLNRAPSEYTVEEILSVTEATPAPVACVACEDEPEACDRRDGCPTYPLWKGLDDMISSYLGGVTLADLIDGTVSVDVMGGCPSDTSGARS